MKKININNSTELQKQIDIVEGKAQVRRLSVREIQSSVSILEEKLSDIGLTKKMMLGIKTTIDVNAQEFPKAYKYTPMSTIFSVEKGSSAWFITRIERERCLTDKYTIYSRFSNDQLLAIVKRSLKNKNLKTIFQIKIQEAAV